MAGSVEMSFDGLAVEYSEYLASLGMKKSTTAFYIKDAEGFFSWVRENTGADKLETGREEIEAYTAYLRRECHRQRKPAVYPPSDVSLNGPA